MKNCFGDWNHQVVSVYAQLLCILYIYTYIYIYNIYNTQYPQYLCISRNSLDTTFVKPQVTPTYWQPHGRSFQCKLAVSSPRYHPGDSRWEPGRLVCPQILRPLPHWISSEFQAIDQPASEGMLLVCKNFRCGYGWKPWHPGEPWWTSKMAGKWILMVWCIYIYTHVYIRNVHTYVHTYIRTYIRTHTYVRTYVHIRTYVRIHTYMHAMHVHPSIHPSIHTGFRPGGWAATCVSKTSSPASDGPYHTSYQVHKISWITQGLRVSSIYLKTHSNWGPKFQVHLYYEALLSRVFSCCHSAFCLEQRFEKNWSKLKG